MLFPESDIHLTVCFPVIRSRNKRLLFTLHIRRNPVQEELMPFVKMNENIPQIMVSFPMRFFFLFIFREVKRRLKLLFGHRFHKRV
jgi:hypothetical protein